MRTFALPKITIAVENSVHCAAVFFELNSWFSRTPQSLRDSSSLSQRGAPKLLFVDISLSIDNVIKALLFLSKRSSAERWGVKLRVAPRLLFVAITLSIRDISKALLFLPKRSSAERWGVKSRIAGVWDPSMRSRMTAMYFSTPQSLRDSSS